MNLFQTMPDFVMHSGGISNFKIECDVLTDDDLDTLAHIIAKKVSFGVVCGVPKGGTRLANALSKYTSDSRTWLVVDDVLTTGRSMEYFSKMLSVPPEYIKGVVMFARGKCPDWVMPIFKMW